MPHLTALLKPLLIWLKLPESSQLCDLDNPENIHILRHIIQRKPFLRNVYLSFYQDILTRIKTVPPDGNIVELGSGASFMKHLAPHIITSDVLSYEGVDKTFSALEMPFQDSSISAFVMVDVFHHIKDSRLFLKEMNRCLKPGGKVVMIEPANTPWSRFIYQNFHHEPFEPEKGWGFTDGGPLTGANMALPWIVFCRDRQQLTTEFSELQLSNIDIHTPIRYLLSGGLSVRQLLPSFLYPLVSLVELVLSPLNFMIGMFMTVELHKTCISEG
ncbi:MAG TPA: class I SAM-dependent methyltransferase [Crinalium sp.]|jgi:SAM-dependent methyltransferase